MPDWKDLLNPAGFIRLEMDMSLIISRRLGLIHQHDVWYRVLIDCLQGEEWRRDGLQPSHLANPSKSGRPGTEFNSHPDCHCQTVREHPRMPPPACLPVPISLAESGSSLLTRLGARVPRGPCRTDVPEQFPFAALLMMSACPMRRAAVYRRPLSRRSFRQPSSSPAQPSPALPCLFARAETGTGWRGRVMRNVPSHSMFPGFPPSSSLVTGLVDGTINGSTQCRLFLFSQGLV